jgi:hypothetical protein
MQPRPWGPKPAGADKAHIFLIEEEPMIGQAASESIVDIGAGQGGEDPFFIRLCSDGGKRRHDASSSHD